MNGESTSMVWPTLASRTAEEQNRSVTVTTTFAAAVSTCLHMPQYVRANVTTQSIIPEVHNVSQHRKSHGHMHKNWKTRSSGDMLVDKDTSTQI